MKALTLKDVSTLCSSLHYSQGFQHVKALGVNVRWQSAHAVGGQVRDHARIHTVRVCEADNGCLEPSCTCNVYSRQPFCQHVAAILIAWVTEPDTFKLYEGGPSEQAAPPPRAASPQDSMAALYTALRRLEIMLLDLLSHGLLTLNRAQIRVMREVEEEVARIRHLGRITAAVLTLIEEVAVLLAIQDGGPHFAAPRKFDEARYAEALIGAWRLTQAALQAVLRQDMAYLRQVIGLPIDEAPGVETRTVELVELAYHTVLDRSLTIETSYLLDLLSGCLMAERVPIPDAQRTQISKVSYDKVLLAEVALIPGYDVDEIVSGLDEPIDRKPVDTQVWRCACKWAGRDWSGPLQRLQDAGAALPGVWAVHAWIAPRQVLIDGGDLYLIDASGQGILAQPAQAIEWALQRAPLAALFGQLKVDADRLSFNALSLLCGAETLELVRLSN